MVSGDSNTDLPIISDLNRLEVLVGSAEAELERLRVSLAVGACGSCGIETHERRQAVVAGLDELRERRAQLRAGGAAAVGAISDVHLGGGR